MRFSRPFLGAVLAGLFTLTAGDASATASLGGTLAAVASGGACSDTKQVPSTTLQDTFLLGGTAACSGDFASADMHGDAAAASVGLRGAALGNGLGSSSVAAMISLTDQWLLTAPVGTAPGMISIPVSLTIEGSVSPGAAFAPFSGRFLDYGLLIRDHYSAGVPGSFLSAGGSVVADGNFSETFNGSVNFRYYGPGSLPMTADVSMNLSIPALWEGTVDFYNTAAISMALPAGFSATTSSGTPLVFAPIPEPGVNATMLAGLALVGWKCRRRQGGGTLPRTL